MDRWPIRTTHLQTTNAAPNAPMTAAHVQWIKLGFEHAAPRDWADTDLSKIVNFDEPQPPLTPASDQTNTGKGF